MAFEWLLFWVRKKIGDGNGARLHLKWSWWTLCSVPGGATLPLPALDGSTTLPPSAFDGSTTLHSSADPFPGEVESGFGEKVLGNVDTEHKILIPNVSALSLAAQRCSPLHTPMSTDDAHKLLRKVVGWRLLDEEGGFKLQCLWKLRDFKCGVELVYRIYKVIEATGHFPNLHLEQPNQVRAELWTSSIGGLSMNDFIVAAKIDEIKTSDLVPRKRVWA
ncbi:hypothetical protein Q3G72_035206 [Acer saccharum]|nr:hypothetical protein Q3G72_035206 [Acer saccharum]